MVDVASATAADTIEERKDLGTDDAATVQYWLTQDKIAEREERNWIRKARKIVKRYRDERPENTPTGHKFNILWSNVQTLKPALYSRVPKPSVERRFKDPAPVGRLAATILERALSYELDVGSFDKSLTGVVEDRLLPGRGVCRVMYVPSFGDVIKAPDVSQDTEAAAIVANKGDAGEKAPAPADIEREVVFEEARVKYIFWEDYREGPARRWEEVPWVRYRSYLTRDELIDRFGRDKGRKISLDFTPKGGEREDNDPAKDIFKKAEIWEIWDKIKREVVWIAPGTPDLVLDQIEDPLKLSGFFPNPDPLLATTTTDKRVPVPDFHEYQDQAIEIDDLTARINKLVKALKVVGVYAADEKQALQQMLDEGVENKMIPVEDWASFMGDKGGPDKLIAWLPIEQVAKVLMSLYDARDRSKEILYEVSGMADIIRGATNPNETATAQSIKQQYVTLRLTEAQKQVVKFARHVILHMAEVIAQHFSNETISLISGYPQLQPVPAMPPMPQAPLSQAAPIPGGPGSPQPAPGAPDPAQAAYQQQLAAWQQAQQAAQAVEAQNQQAQADFNAAVDLLRKDAAHDFKIDIEADSMVEQDDQREQQNRTEFLQQFIPLLEQVVPIAQGNPPMAALAKEITMFAVRGFKTARTLEETIEKAFDAIAKLPPHPSQQPDKGDDGQADMAKIQAQQAADKDRLQLEQQNIQAKASADQQAKAAAGELELRKMAQDHDQFLQRLDAETKAKIEIANADADIKLRVADIQAAAGIEEARLKASLDQQTTLDQAVIGTLGAADDGATGEAFPPATAAAPAPRAPVMPSQIILGANGEAVDLQQHSQQLADAAQRLAAIHEQMMAGHQDAGVRHQEVIAALTRPRHRTVTLGAPAPDGTRQAQMVEQIAPDMATVQ